MTSTETTVPQADPQTTASMVLRTVLAHFLDNWDDEPLEPNTTPEALAEAVKVLYGQDVLTQQASLLPMLKSGRLQAGPQLAQRISQECIAYIMGNADDIIIGQNYDMIQFGRLLLLVLWGDPLESFITFSIAQEGIATAMAH